MEKYMCAHLVGQDLVWQWVRVHDVRVNYPSKFGPKPRRPDTSFIVYFCYEPVPNIF
jgi:hypothetical protein